MVSLERQQQALPPVDSCTDTAGRKAPFSHWQ